MVGKRTFQNPREHIEELGAEDIESAGRRKFPRFKDAVEFTMAERTKAVLKEQLRTGVDRDAFEKYRRSDEEVGIFHTSEAAQQLTAASS